MAISTSSDRTSLLRRIFAPDRTMATKVPHVALAFWAVKLLTTGMGEAMSDFIASLDPMLAVLVLAGALVGFGWLFRRQLTATAYRPVPYWGTVALIAVFGTMAADVVHVVLGNTVTTLCYALAVAGVLVLWHRREGSLSVHSITTPRRELFYWATVASTFALGTAAGDFAADTMGLGYRDSAVLFAALMLLLAAAWRFARRPGVPVFWAAYVLTRPLGASIADWLGKPSPKGLDLGDGVVSTGALVVFLVVLTWLERSGHDRPHHGGHGSDGGRSETPGPRFAE